MGVLLDSSVVIAAERSGQSPRDLMLKIERAFGQQPIALSAIGYTELAHGQYRAETDARRSARRHFLDALTARLPVHPYTAETAQIAARIDAEQRANNVTIPFADLLIGATALSLGFSLLTANVRHFRLIPNLNVIPF